MTTYTIVFSKQARKDTDELTQKQKVKLQEILTNIIAINPYIGKSLKGDLEGLYSYRLNRKAKIVVMPITTRKKTEEMHFRN